MKLSQCLTPLFAVSLAAVGCGGAVTAGAGLGRLGQRVSAHASTLPQGAEACALHEALAAQPGSADKALAEVCAKPMKSDLLWRRAMVVLAAHADRLDAFAAGKGERQGQMDAALTGVDGPGWVDVDGQEAAARDAVTQLVEQMRTNAAKGDLEKALKDAAPHVKTVCEGLEPYLAAQAKAFGDAAREVEKKRVAKTDRRCGSLDTRPVCIGDSSADRVVYANAIGQLGALEQSHGDARESVAAFCAVHAKLVGAAEGGRLSDDKTAVEVAEAVKASHAAAAPPAETKPGAKPPPKK